MVKCLSEQKNFDVNVRMSNGETALHIAAQLGHSNMLGEMIEKGGDLSVRDDEDGHTPLHDCLQQVYFESGNMEEKCNKFIEVWDKVVKNSVQWWCKKNEIVEEPAHGSREYLELQRKAVYYLRSSVENHDGLSVLQFAADRGLIKCVQTMLSTKGVFVLQATPSSNGKPSGYEIDVTNLCPEFFVRKRDMYTQSELQKLMDKTRDNRGRRR